MESRENNYEPNAMVILKPNYSFYERKIIYHLINQIPPEYEHVKGTNFEVDMPISKELQSLHRTSIKQATETLTSVKVRNETEYSYGVFVPFPEVKIDFEKGRLTATIYDKIMPRLIAMQKYGYIRYKLAEALSLEKKHSQRLFELLLMNHGINKNHIWKIELKDFKSLMYCENKYKNRIQDFNKYVLIPTLEDINKNTSVNAKCEVVKEGRINYLIFVIKVREKLQKGKEKLDIKKLDERSLRCWRKLEEFGIIKDDLLRKIVLNEDLQSKFWKWLSKNNDNIKNGYFNNVAGLILSYLNVK
jgi:hypothetical protein